MQAATLGKWLSYATLAGGPGHVSGPFHVIGKRKGNISVYCMLFKHHSLRNLPGHCSSRQTTQLLGFLALFGTYTFIEGAVTALLGHGSKFGGVLRTVGGGKE
jgi:hypothetical protein